MSKPLGTEDIEDVVSSVRRLVSHEVRPRPVSRDLGQDKLLLTSAFLVVSEAADDVAPSPGDAADPQAEVSGQPAAGVEALDEVISDLSAPLQIVDGEWEETFWSEPEPDLAELALGAEDAELVPVVDLDLSELDLPELDPPPEPWAQPDQVWSQDAPIPFVPLHRKPGRVQSVILPPDPPDAAVLHPIPDAEANSDPDPEPQVFFAAAEDGDASDGDVLTGDTSADSGFAGEVASAALPGADADLTYAGIVAETEAEAEAADMAGLAANDMTQVMTDRDGNPVTVLDEDALSQIVRQLIREELQGVLGERITHNVRKLVRAEINRALTAQALE